MQACARKLQPLSMEGLHHATSAVALGRPFNVLRTCIPTRVTSRRIFIVLMLRISVAGLMCLLIFLNYHVLSIFVMNVWLLCEHIVLELHCNPISKFLQCKEVNKHTLNAVTCHEEIDSRVYEFPTFDEYTKGCFV